MHKTNKLQKEIDKSVIAGNFNLPLLASRGTDSGRKAEALILVLYLKAFPPALGIRVSTFSLFPRVLPAVQLPLHVDLWVWDPTGLWLRNS